MESLSSYFTANPANFTLLAILFAIVILYFILRKFIKLTVILLIVILLAGGVNLLKDPASMPGKIKTTVQTFVAGGEQMWDKFSSLWRDTKDLADKAKRTPGEINKLLDTAKEKVGEDYQSKDAAKEKPKK
ncbi:MAG TPA: hypothetical protein PKV11_04865 [Smithella sp.]|nr:hypothetical protein [Smithella sp.]